MALNFGKVKGQAQKGLKYYDYKMGDNSVRMVGGILPRYLYWVDLPDGNKRIPFECLTFDRETESFDNALPDPVRERFPDLKCGWSYAVLCIDDGEVKILNLKKKLFQQILTAAEDLGDPTDPETGWECFFKKVKTGPHAFNIEYQLQPLKCKPRPLTAEELKLVEETKSIEELIPKESVEDQRKRLDKLLNKTNKEEEAPADDAILDEIGELPDSTEETIADIA